VADQRRLDPGPVAVDAAARLLLERAPRLGRVRLGVVDGPSGSGKSTFGAAWVTALQAAGCAASLFSSDLLATWDEPFGWWERFDAGVLQPLADGAPGRIQLTDWSTGHPMPGGWLTIPSADALILEGVSCGRTALDDRASVLVWVEVPDRDARLERAVRRDGESSRAQLAAWQDAEDAFFQADRTADRADIVVVG
jgi:uridine kinase